MPRSYGLFMHTTKFRSDLAVAQGDQNLLVCTDYLLILSYFDSFQKIWIKLYLCISCLLVN